MGQTQQIDAQNGEQNEADTTTDIMSECNCDSETIDIGLEAMTVDAVRSTNDDVDQKIAALEDEIDALMDAQEVVTSVRESLDLDAGQQTVDAVDSTVEYVQSLESDVREYEESELTELRESIVADSAYEADDVADMDKDTLMAVDGAIDHSEDTESDSDGGSLSLPTNEVSNDSGGVSSGDSELFDPRTLYKDGSDN